MKVVNYVGGREVIAAGTLVLGGGDVLASISIDDITYHFVMAHSFEPPTLSQSNPGPKSLMLTISGSYHTSCMWILSEVGTINRRSIDLACEVTWYAAFQERPASGKISYTFTAGPEQILGLPG